MFATAVRTGATRVRSKADAADQRPIRSNQSHPRQGGLDGLGDGRAARALHNERLLATLRECHEETELRVKWLTTRLKEAAPQELVFR